MQAARRRRLYNEMIMHVNRHESTAAAAPTSKVASVLSADCQQIRLTGRAFDADSMTNISPSIASYLNGKKLLNEAHNPLHQLCRRIRLFFDRQFPGTFSFHQLDDPIVTPEANFDELLIPKSHPSRSPSDSYYLNRNAMLRTHMTAHERVIIASNPEKQAFLLAGDVYRRDEIDHSHMPIFHQMEGVRLFSPDELLRRKEELMAIASRTPALNDLPLNSFPSTYDPSLTRLALADLYQTLSGLLFFLFGPSTVAFWQPTYFPFTQPSLEVEMAQCDNPGKRVEIFGSGILQHSVLPAQITASNRGTIAWAFGLGLERIAMLLHGIPDIRLFHSADPRFIRQFSAADAEGSPPVKFVPYSKFPPINRDISFFLPLRKTFGGVTFNEEKDQFAANDFFELVRDSAGDLIESVCLIDQYSTRVCQTTGSHHAVVVVQFFHHLVRSYASKRLPAMLD
jgi:phenylalanyl-tRNA synthetase alpha chain